MGSFIIPAGKSTNKTSVEIAEFDETFIAQVIRDMMGHRLGKYTYPVG